MNQHMCHIHIYIYVYIPIMYIIIIYVYRGMGIGMVWLDVGFFVTPTACRCGASPRQDGLQHGLVGHVAMTAVAVRMVPGKLMGKEGMIGMENLRSHQVPSSDSCSFHQMFDKI